MRAAVSPCTADPPPLLGTVPPPPPPSSPGRSLPVPLLSANLRSSVSVPMFSTFCLNSSCTCRERCSGMQSGTRGVSPWDWGGEGGAHLPDLHVGVLHRVRVGADEALHVAQVGFLHLLEALRGWGDGGVPMEGWHIPRGRHRHGWVRAGQGRAPPRHHRAPHGHIPHTTAPPVPRPHGHILCATTTSPCPHPSPRQHRIPAVMLPVPPPPPVVVPPLPPPTHTPWPTPPSSARSHCGRCCIYPPRASALLQPSGTSALPAGGQRGEMQGWGGGATTTQGRKGGVTLSMSFWLVPSRRSRSCSWHLLW